MTHLLLVEDDVALGKSVCEALHSLGHIPLWKRSVVDVQRAVPEIRSHSPALGAALIDVSLPDGDGFEVAALIKREHPMPILFLSAHFEMENRLKALDLGAVDFIPKPFHLRELEIRLNRVLLAAPSERKRALPGCDVNFTEQSITYADGRRVFPKTTDFRLLELLISSSPAVLSKEELDAKIFGKLGRADVPRSLDNAIVRLRGLLGSEAGAYLRTVRGIGYQWCDVRLDTVVHSPG